MRLCLTAATLTLTSGTIDMERGLVCGTARDTPPCQAPLLAGNSQLWDTPTCNYRGTTHSTHSSAQTYMAGHAHLCTHEVRHNRDPPALYIWETHAKLGSVCRPKPHYMINCHGPCDAVERPLGEIIGLKRLGDTEANDDGEARIYLW